MELSAARHRALSLLGVPADQHAAVFAIQDQIDAWRADHPGQDPFLSGECDELYAALGRIVGKGLLP